MHSVAIVTLIDGKNSHALQCWMQLFFWLIKYLLNYLDYVSNKAPTEFNGSGRLSACAPL